MIKYVYWDVELEFSRNGTPSSVYGGVSLNPDTIKAYYGDFLQAPDLAEETAGRTSVEYKSEAEPEGELDVKKEKGVYGFRRDKAGPYIMDFMVKACIKGAASVSKLTTQIRGLKNQLSEGLEVAPVEIHFHRNGSVVSRADGMLEIKGKVSGPQGSRQIQTWKEYITGAKVSFSVNYLDTKIITEEVFRDIWEVAQRVGLGSVRSMDKGKFTVVKLEKRES